MHVHFRNTRSVLIAAVGFGVASLVGLTGMALAYVLVVAAMGDTPSQLPTAAPADAPRTSASSGTSTATVP